MSTRTTKNANLNPDPEPSSNQVVHRLDRYTTGVILAARSLRAQQAMVAAFAERRVWKCYIAVCAGVPPARTMVDAPIARHPTNRLKMVRLHPSAHPRLRASAPPPLRARRAGRRGQGGSEEEQKRRPPPLPPPGGGV